MTAKEYEYKLLQMRRQMVRVATDIFHDTEDAEDVVQEVYLRMLERGWHEGDNVEALCLRATKNLCVSAWRRQKLWETEQLDNAKSVMSPESADTRMLQSEQQAGVEQAISTLPPSEQKIIRLSMQDMSPQDITKETGMSNRSVSTMLWSAKKKMITLLKRRNND